MQPVKEQKLLFFLDITPLFSSRYHFLSRTRCQISREHCGFSPKALKVGDEARNGTYSTSPKGAANCGETPPGRPHKTRNWKTFSFPFCSFCGDISPLQFALIGLDNLTEWTIKVDLFVLSRVHASSLARWYTTAGCEMITGTGDNWN